MESLTNANGLFQVFDFIGDTGYMVAAVVLLVLCVLFCFFGLRGVRVLMAIGGFLIGFVCGFVIGSFAGLSLTVAAVSGAIAGILLAIIAFNLYIALWFIAVWAVAAVALIRVLPQFGLSGVPVYAVAAVVGLLLGILVLKIAEIVILIATAIGGGGGAAACVGYLFPENTEMLTLVLWAVLAVIGLVLQFMYFFKKHKEKKEQKSAVKQEMKKSKEAQVEEAMNILDLDDDFEVIDDE